MAYQVCFQEINNTEGTQPETHASVLHRCLGRLESILHSEASPVVYYVVVKDLANFEQYILYSLSDKL